MASTILSRFLPPDTGERSVYETLLRNDEDSDESDVEERAGLAIDEENLGVDLHGLGVDGMLTEDAESRVMSPARQPRNRTPQRRQSVRVPREGVYSDDAETLQITDEDDGDVPQSLLLEDELHELPPRPSEDLHTPRPVRNNQARPQRLLSSQQLPESRVPGLINPKERALWRWANVENLDNFLMDVYEYFLGNGIFSIVLSKILNLLTLAFVVGFSTFLTSCVDYSKIPTSKKMDQILVEKCTRNLSGATNILIWLFALFWIWRFFQLFLDIRRLRHMQHFFHHLLDLSDADIQTVSWQEIVKRLMLLRDSNATTAVSNERHRRFVGSQSKQRMDAHDIANRLMRRDNYLIAMINKDILDLTLPIPFLRNRQLFSKTIEWSLSQCILDYVFNEHGQVRPLFVKDSHRRALSDGLKRRFRFAGIMNVVCAPFIIVYFLMLYFFRYFNEYQKNPSQIGSRQYTPLAEWKFREFNELWHLYQRRSNMSYPFASRYIDQFPKDKTVQMAGFVAFIAGALASVLALASVIDPNLFLEFEITPERTVLFYLGIFGTIWAVARGTVPEETLVFDPEYALRNVIEYTHYCPKHWQGRLHSDEVRTEFAILYRMKIVVFLEEMLSIIFTPLVLWFTLPNCSDKIIDFFREFTVHVDGLGYVCSFAVFDFKKGTNTSAAGSRPPTLREDYYSTKDGKMLASYYGFIDNYVTNQKPNAPYLHPPNKSKFHLPPAFPGLGSSTIQAQQNARDPPVRTSTSRQGRQVKKTGYSVYDLANQPTRRTPSFQTAGVSSSPMASVLLDPHHQPSLRNLRSTSKSYGQPGLRATRTLAFEDPPVGERPYSDDEISENEVERSHLGESWKTTRAGTVDGDDHKEEESASDNQEEPGVLGLVYRFSKAQTEGRGAGVRI